MECYSDGRQGPFKRDCRTRLQKGLEAMDSRKTSIAKHREGNMDLTGGHLRKRDYSVERSPTSVEKSK